MTTRDVHASRDDAVQALQQLAADAQQLAAAATELAAALGDENPLQATIDRAAKTYMARLKPVSRGASVVLQALQRLP